jgi:hypothetical protein
MKMSENHGESHWDNLETTSNITQYIICMMKVIVKVSQSVSAKNKKDQKDCQKSSGNSP